MEQKPSSELPVGRIAGVFGIRGELKCDPTSAGRTLFCAGARFRLQFPDGSSREVHLASARDHKGRILVRLPAIESANDAARYVGATLYAHRGEIELGPGEYLDADLVGCVLVDSSGRQLGSVSAVEHYPGSDMLVVNGKLVPMVSAFIKAVDLQRSRITVDIPPGLLDDSEAEQA